VIAVVVKVVIVVAVAGRQPVSLCASNSSNAIFTRIFDTIVVIPLPQAIDLNWYPISKLPGHSITDIIAALPQNSCVDFVRITTITFSGVVFSSLAVSILFATGSKYS
jgi:hypothetical protein